MLLWRTIATLESNPMINQSINFDNKQSYCCLAPITKAILYYSSSSIARKDRIQKTRKRKIIIYPISDMFEEKIQIADDTFLLQRPKKYTYFNNYAFVFERKRQNSSYYHCADYRTFKCKTRLVLGPGPTNREFKQFRNHNHSPRHNAKRNLPFSHPISISISPAD